MNHRLPLSCALIAGIAITVIAAGAGCSSSTGPPLIPVSGTVTTTGGPLAGADLMFLPADADGNGGTAKTDDKGQFTVTYIRGGDGIPAGEYRVVISKRVMPDGSAPPPDVEPMDSPATETLPPRYSSQRETSLTATVTSGGEPLEFTLK